MTTRTMKHLKIYHLQTLNSNAIEAADVAREELGCVDEEGATGSEFVDGIYSCKQHEGERDLQLLLHQAG